MEIINYVGFENGTTKGSLKKSRRTVSENNDFYLNNKIYKPSRNYVHKDKLYNENVYTEPLNIKRGVIKLCTLSLIVTLSVYGFRHGFTKGKVLPNGEVEEDLWTRITKEEIKEVPAIPESSVTYTTYEVSPGDTLEGITRHFGLKNISTIISCNGIQDARFIRVGRNLEIPSVDGLKVIVEEGSTLEGLSSRYDLCVEDLMEANAITGDLKKGDAVFIPGAYLDKESLNRVMGETFAYPLRTRFSYSCYYGPMLNPITGENYVHAGVDMSCPEGSSVYATNSGSVCYVGSSRFLGRYIIVKHPNGYMSVYGSLSKVLVKKGSRVTQGSVLGRVGYDAFSQVPHLHFGLYKNGRVVDPTSILK